MTAMRGRAAVTWPKQGSTGGDQVLERVNELLLEPLE
jgi:hypothetical protein